MNFDVQCFESKALGEKYYQATHSSGLTVLVYPKKLSTSYAMFSTKYGSLERTFRRDGEEFVTVPDGVAHFLEHKLFEEPDGSDVFAKFASLGASANAFTSHEMTSYLFSTTDYLDECLAIWLDFVTPPHFTKENVQKEQGIIGQEIGMCDDNPGNRLYYSLLEGLYQKHNVRVNIAGTVKTIAEITPELLYRCYETFYHPSNMLLTVCGDTTLNAVMDTVSRVLPAKVALISVDRSYPAENEALCRPYTEFSMEVATPLFACGVKDLAVFASPVEKAKHAVLAEMLGKCFFSRSAEFYNELYDNGLIVKDIDYSYEAMNACAYLMIAGESERPLDAYHRIENLLKNIHQNIPSMETFSRIKRVMYANYIRSFDSTEEIAGALTDHFFHGMELFSFGDIISSVCYEDFTHFCKTFFAHKKFSLSVITPVNNKRREDGNA